MNTKKQVVNTKMPTYDKENAITMEKLKRGEVCLVQGFRQSMTPLLKNGQVCEVAPVTDETDLKKNDIVFVRVNRHFYLHKITAIRRKSFQISNNHCHINGWVSRKCIYGIVTNVAPSSNS